MTREALSCPMDFKQIMFAIFILCIIYVVFIAGLD